MPFTKLLFLLLLVNHVSSESQGYTYNTSILFTSTSLFGNGLQLQNFEIKGYIMGDGKSSTSAPATAYWNMMEALEKAAKELCANAVFEFSWEFVVDFVSSNSNSNYDHYANAAVGSGMAVCTLSPFPCPC